MYSLGFTIKTEENTTCSLVAVFQCPAYLTFWRTGLTRPKSMLTRGSWSRREITYLQSDPRFYTLTSLLYQNSNIYFLYLLSSFSTCCPPEPASCPVPDGIPMKEQAIAKFQIE